MEPALVPYVFQKAFHIMKSGRPGPVLIDLPIDVQLAEIEFDIDTYQPMEAYKPAATRAQAEKALAMLNEAERPLIVAGVASSTPMRPTFWSNSPKSPAFRSSRP